MRLLSVLSFLSITFIAFGHADGVRNRLEQARLKGESFKSLEGGKELVPFWSRDETLFFFRLGKSGGDFQFLSVDLTNGNRNAAFDHERMAKALASVDGQDIKADRLPIEHIETSPIRGVLRVFALGKMWLYNTVDSSLVMEQQSLPAAALLSGEQALQGSKFSGTPASLTFTNESQQAIHLNWVRKDRSWKSYGEIEPGKSVTQSSRMGHVWLFSDPQGRVIGGAQVSSYPGVAVITDDLVSAAKADPAAENELSPDGKWKAVIGGHNLSIVSTSGGNPVYQTKDGVKNDHWKGPIHWSPDSKKVIAHRVREVGERQIHIVESSPMDQIQPKLQTFEYPKPGDPIRQSKPRLIDVGKRAEIPIKDALFDNPWSIDQGEWSPDSREFSFLYNQRGHQVMRIIGVDSESGIARTIHEERSTTFIDYSQKTFIKRLQDSRELLWASERDGHNHIYLIDQVSGRIRNAVTHGESNVREVMEVNAKDRNLLIRINGIAGQDPYHDHFARVSLDGSAFTRLTAGDGTHEVLISSDGRLLLDIWSRVDQPEVVELRDAKTGKMIAELSRGDESAMVKAGWSAPERFKAKGRDGVTDIHGVIYRPSDFDPNRKYPVLEYIYAGPHDFHLPTKFAAWRGENRMAELGFIVVRIEGMGTNWRSKAFHDVCWKNLMDSGFPDRIPWIKAAAATRPWMDLSRVGIYGGSAGGQSTVAGLLNHGDFYKVGVADCGCHDNRMDKIWWNEAWMGWPVDESYERNSNVTHAHQLTGKLLLMVGELDHNVDPASTAQVAAALQRADKYFEYLPVMNAGHGSAETPYGNYRRAEFLIRHLQPPQVD
jgi:dipeptidyl aminopeptidase/acylaminoacyl peptidase